jgi:hypothetical protein
MLASLLRAGLAFVAEAGEVSNVISREADLTLSDG